MQLLKLMSEGMRENIVATENFGNRETSFEKKKKEMMESPCKSLALTRAVAESIR